MMTIKNSMQVVYYKIVPTRKPQIFFLFENINYRV